MERLVKIVKDKKLNLRKFMNDEDIMYIVEKWHTLAEDETGSKIDYEQYLVDCYNEVLENI